MALTALQANLVVSWVLSNSNGVFGPTTQGLDGLEYNLGDLNSIFNEVYVASLTIGASATTTINLQSGLTDLTYQSLDFSALLFLFALPAGAGVTVAPGGTNGLDVFGGTNTVTVPVNGCLFWGGDPAGTGLTVSGTAKNLSFTNVSGSTSLTLELVIAGKSP